MSLGNRARGGRAEFSWSTVSDKSFSERSHYLGASVHARTNERGVNNPGWYLEGGEDTARKSDTPLEKELDEVKRREAELMRAALGLPPLPDGGERDDCDGKKRRKERKERLSDGR